MQIDQAIERELSSDKPDAQRVDRLAAAWAKLAEQERILDGRPLPGSRRPERQSTPKRAKVEPE